jgi:hypothetical protein
MGKKSNKNADAPPDPEAQAKMVITAIKSYAQPVFQKVVDLGDDNDFSFLQRTMEIIRQSEAEQVKSCSILLLTAGKSDVAVMATTASDQQKIDPSAWVQATLDAVNTVDHIKPTATEGRGRAICNPEAFPIKEVDSASAAGFQYLKSVGAMVEDDDSSEEFYNLNDI